MTTTLLQPLFLLCLLALTACQTESTELPMTSETPVRFDDARAEQIYHNYLDLQQALADSDAKHAATAAGKLNDEFSDSQTELRYLARHIAASDDTEVQRRYFLHMTDQLEPVFSDCLTQGTIYRMHCQKANKGEGADWFSEANRIYNPYLGAATPACGTVVSQIRGRG